MPWQLCRAVTLPRGWRGAFTIWWPQWRQRPRLRLQVLWFLARMHWGIMIVRLSRSHGLVLVAALARPLHRLHLQRLQRQV